MKKLSILTLALVVTAAWGFRDSAAWQTEPPKAAAIPDLATQGPVPQADPEAINLVQQARARLWERQSVRADLDQIVALGNYRFRSTGSYLSSGLSSGDLKYRLEFRSELQGLRGVFLEVCDGQVLHTRKEISEIKASLTSAPASDVQLSRREIQKILRAVKESGQHADLTDAKLAAQIGLGGLPAVLASLERSMVFEAVRAENVDGREYMVVQGRWNGERLDQLMSGLGPLTAQISNFLPDLVRVYFARETLFPEKFLYLKLTSAERQTYHPLVSVEFKNVVLDQPVPQQQFIYQPLQGSEERDDTANFLQLLQPAPEKKSESAQAPLP